MVFATVDGGDHLLRSFCDPETGRCRQTSLGRRSPDTERMKAEFDLGRRSAEVRLAAARETIERQAGINRALDTAGPLGRGLLVAGTHALFAQDTSGQIF